MSPWVRARLFPGALALFALGTPAAATWSIVVIDRSTGEVCIAAATCLADFNLKRALPVVLVGKGAAAAQSFIDTSGRNRTLIRDDMLLGMTPAEILADLAMHDSAHQSRQYGIVSFDGAPVTFTGTQAGAAKHGVVGRQGTLSYAIQGNVLTGEVVVTAAEDALLHSRGDLGQRVMAAMEAARGLGGDGRCSCQSGPPPSCGAPPPSFTKTAHTAFVVLARLGDVDGTCNQADGCANGSYYLSRKAIGNWSDPDAVIELNRRYLQWRRNKAGLPDHLSTRVEPSAQRLVADGQTSTRVLVRLVDLDGEPLTAGGQVLTITDVSPGGGGHAAVGAVVDHGDGTHEFELVAGTLPGDAHLRIEVQDGTAAVRLFPDLVVPVDPPAELYVGHATVSATGGASVPFVVARPADAGRLCRIFASASGTLPGTPFGGGLLPLNSDRVLRWTFGYPTQLFPGSQAPLDGGGRLEATFEALPGLLAPFVGGRLDFCAVIGVSAPVDFTNGVAFDVLP